VSTAVSKERAVGARKGPRSFQSVRLPNTSDRAAALYGGRDFPEIQSKVRVRMPQSRIDVGWFFGWGRNVHALLSVLPPEKLRGSGIFFRDSF